MCNPCDVGICDVRECKDRSCVSSDAYDPIHAEREYKHTYQEENMVSHIIYD